QACASCREYQERLVGADSLLRSMPELSLVGDGDSARLRLEARLSELATGGSSVEPCESYLGLISGDLDGVLEPAEQQQLSRHCQACVACRDYWQRLGTLRQSLVGLELIEPSEGFLGWIH